ncbi:MAG: peptidoglycan synthetase [Chlorobi bacterium]|nr:peptidoglycan synthetase [Chlorobiota bacterium]
MNKSLQKVHFIAIGGSAMHNLALTLHDAGVEVTGSDDVIYDPSKTRLADAGILPPRFGWFPEKITPDLDAVIVGMHARSDNPELLRAKELGIPLYSYPEFLYRHAKDKTRLVVAGSHGKTTVTAMVIHVMTRAGLDTDFMVGSQLRGFQRMIRLTPDAPYMVIEGDEYPTSPLDPRPKFLHYKPHHTVITGIALDHINKFDTFDKYLEQFAAYVRTIEPGGTLVYFEEDPHLPKLATLRDDIRKIPYRTPSYEIIDGIYYLITPYGRVPMKIFGRHNMQNAEGARLLLQAIGVDDRTFYDHIRTFEGAGMRLETLYDDGNTVIIRDFAHAPSKVKASVEAVRERYPDKKLTAVLELHTYSSLNKKFIPHYKGTLEPADEAVVFYSPEAVKIKRLDPIEPEFIRQAFGRPDLKVFTDDREFKRYMENLPKDNNVLLLMSSGHLGGIEVRDLVEE